MTIIKFYLSVKGPILKKELENHGYAILLDMYAQVSSILCPHHYHKGQK